MELYLHGCHGPAYIFLLESQLSLFIYLLINTSIFLLLIHMIYFLGLNLITHVEYVIW